MKLVPGNLILGLLFVVAIGLTSSESVAQQTKTDVYFAGQIWQGTGEPIENGAMVVVDGVITAIGPRDEISIPGVAERHDFGSQVLIPGLVLPQTSLGGNQTEERTITPQVHALDGFDFFAERDSLIESGITTVQVSPARVRLMPGIGGVVKLAGDDLADRVLQEEESLQIVLTAASRQPPRIYEPSVGPVSEDRPLNATRPQVATLSASMAALRQIFKAAIAGESADDEIVEAVARVIESKKPVRIAASTTPEIRGAISLAKEFGIKVILTDCEGLEIFKDAFAQWKDSVAGVVLTANVPGSISNPSLEQIELQKEPWTFARELLDAEIPVAIAPKQSTSLTSSMFVAGQFMRGGLSHAELLSALTYSSASMMGIDDHVGSLSVGKHADFVVLSGKPFEMHSRVRATYVAGAPLFERSMSPATTVVSASRVYVGDGKYLNDGQVVVKGHTVRGVGSNVSAPAGANIRQFKDAVIVPGFVDMGTGLGLGGPLSGNTTLGTKLGEQLYPEDPAIEYARQNGITTALLAGSGSNATPVVAFKLGKDARVVGDPMAIKFRLSGSTSAAIASAEKQLAAGKKYVDSWKKYEKDLAEYKEKVKAEAAKPKPKTAAKKEEKKADSKEADSKKPEEKKDSGKEKEKDKPKPEEKKEPEKGTDKDKDKEKEKDKDEKKKKPLPDPITGTWEGEIDVERFPPEFRAITIEMELAEDGTVTGSLAMMRQDVELSAGSYDRESRALSITIERRGREVTISGELNADGEFEGTTELGRIGEVRVTAKRTVDKSKKPEPEEEKKEEKKDKPEKKDPEKEKDEKKEKPPEGDKDKEKPADKDKKKPESKEADKKEEKPAEKKEEKKPALKEPKKPRKVEALEPYHALFAKEIPALVETRELFTIKESAKLFSEKYGVRTIIVGADALAREPDALADQDVSVIAGPKLNVSVPRQLEATNLPQLLANERLAFAFQSSGTTGSGQLPGAIQYSVSRGLSTIDALDGLTSSPAKMLSEKATFGSIAAGKDADLIVLSGPPFEFSTKILAVMIDGEWVYERKEEK